MTVVLPQTEPTRGLAALLTSRRSTKRFDSSRSLPLGEISALLWAAAGETDPGHRTSPSAKTTYPVELTLIAGDVDGLDAGSFGYDPLRHALVPGPGGDHRLPIAAATLDARDWLAECPALLLLTADISAARSRFPGQPAEHGERFVWMEAGHTAQNVYLAASEQRLGTCLVAGIDDDGLASVSSTLVPDRHQVFGVMGLGFAAPAQQS